MTEEEEVVKEDKDDDDDDDDDDGEDDEEDVDEEDSLPFTSMTRSFSHTLIVPREESIGRGDGYASV